MSPAAVLPLKPRVITPRTDRVFRGEFGPDRLVVRVILEFRVKTVHYHPRSPDGCFHLGDRPRKLGASTFSAWATSDLGRPDLHYVDFSTTLPSFGDRVRALMAGVGNFLDSIVIR